MEIWIPLLVLGLIVLVPFAYVIGQYNGFVSLRNQISEAWSNIDTELKRRYDLIPNLVETVKGYAKHEREVFERVAAQRQACMANNGAPEAQVADENKLAGGLRDMMAVVENYPDLKADTGFLKLQRELVITEDRIQAARRFYNGNVRDYRNKRESFPTNVIAGVFKFGPREFLEFEPAVQQVPSVNIAG